MIQIASNEYGRIDEADIVASNLPLPDVKRQKNAIKRIPSPARPHHQLSDLSARSVVNRLPSHPSTLSPLEPAVHIRGPPAEQSPWERSLDGGHGTSGDHNTTLPSQIEDDTSETRAYWHETASYNSQDPEKGFHKNTLRQPSHHTLHEPLSKVEYTYSDITSEDSDLESRALWILVSALPPGALPHHSPLLTLSPP